MTSLPRIRTLKSSSRGQSLVEFALVVPLLMVVAFIITEFGRALWTQNLLTQAAGNAARAAIVSTGGTYLTAATDAANRLLNPVGLGTTSSNPSKIEVTVEDLAGTQVVRVTVSRTFSFIPGSAGQGTGLPTMPGAGKTNQITLTDIPLRGEAVMDTQPSFSATP